jgi:hypothetical protein
MSFFCWLKNTSLWKVLLKFQDFDNKIGIQRRGKIQFISSVFVPLKFPIQSIQNLESGINLPTQKPTKFFPERIFRLAAGFSNLPGR